MTVIKVLNRDEEFIANLEIFDIDYCWKMNGEHSLSFSCLDDVIQEGYRLLYKTKYHQWREFIVTEPVLKHYDDEIIYDVYAEDSFYETLGDFVLDVRPQGVTAQYALGRALETSRWEVGRVEGLGNGSTNFYRESVKSAVHKIIEEWQAEFDTRIEVSGNQITHRYVDLYKEMGDYHGKRFVYNKDLLGVERTINMDGFCTALYGFGKGEELESGGYGRRIDFSEVNGGKAYVENLEAKSKYGRKDGNSKAHIFASVEFDEVTDKEELLKLTQEELKRRSKPNVTYSCNTANLPWDFEKVNRGDTVIVLDKDIDLAIQARVVEYHEHDDTEQVILGDYRPIISDTINKANKYINDFRSKSGVWDKADLFEEDGLDADVLKDLIPKLNEEMNQRGGWVTISDNGEGIMTVDDPVNPTMAIQILGGSFRIANSKLADDSWNWRTFGDGNGFVADYITAGTMTANLIKAGILTDRKGKFFLNMETGALNFGDKITYNPVTDKFEIDAGSVMLKSGNNVNDFATELKVETSGISSRVSGLVRKTDTTNRNLSTVSRSVSEVKQQADSISSTVKQKVGKNELVSEINQRADGIRLKGQSITLDGNTNVMGTFEVPGSSIFGTINANTIDVTNLNAGNITSGDLNRPYSYGNFSNGTDFNLKGNSVSFSGNSSYIQINDRGNRGQVLINGTVQAYGSGYSYELNRGGLYGQGYRMLATDGGVTQLHGPHNNSPSITIGRDGIVNIGALKVRSLFVNGKEIKG